MLLFVIRHGDPIYNPDSLTPKGQRQAEALARRFATHKLDRIFASPLKRAHDTAVPTSELLGIPIETEEWTSEALAWDEFTFNDPNHNGRKRWLFIKPGHLYHNEKDHFRNKDWRECECLQNLDGYFKPETCYDRISAASDEFLAKLGYQKEGHIYKIIKPSNERVALFCHEGFSMCWFPYLLGIPPHLFWSTFGLSHTGVNIVYFENHPDGYTFPRCLAWDDLSHIYEDRLPLQFQNRIDL
ncbi:MAG: histidine phosphatase family protein [Lentisphaerae bacterium]|jgi:broad specificity phosphatase PhoE|nr:histidine phosphatase family protein [Lentisphaerota bacterium]